ncbi:MAG: helix-turn-helix domain-containing protein [Cyclobacteriaceae bacterium]|nr:helix-turn-helix domain-containing protein [Cyclobacteriaceae bacterium]
MVVKLNENIRFVRKQLNLTQDQFAQQLDIKRSLVGAYEEGRAEPRLELLQKMATLAGLSVDLLISRDISQLKEYEKKLARSKEVLVVTVDEENRDNIELVPHKAAAGYLNGYADVEYIKELPRFKLPIPLLSRGTFRAFEITGDSMLPILPGTIVIGEWVEDIHSLKNGKSYVLVTEREGIVYKRVFNYLQENGKLFLVSDNRQYAPYQLDAAEVIEAWGAKAYISVQFPDANTKNEMSMDQLSDVVMELKQELKFLKSEKSENKPTKKSS